MGQFNWDDYEVEKEQASPVMASTSSNRAFNWDDHPIEPSVDPKTSSVTAAMTGLIQGAVPFAAPIAGAGRAAMNAVTGVSGPLAGGSVGDILDDYRSGRDQFQGDARAAAEANPKTAFAGNLAGGFANPLFKNADSLPKIASASAAQGLGLSEADLTRGEIGKAARDTGLSTAGGVLGYGAGKVIPKLWEGTKYFGKKGLTTLGPNEEAINARLAGKAQDSAKNYAELADDMGGSLKKLQKQIGEFGKAAKETLSSEPTIPKPYITGTLDESLNSLKLDGKLIGPTDKEAANLIQSFQDDIKQLGDNISEKDLKSLIQKMDDNINWEDQSRDKINNILKDIRSKFDSTLKFQNKSYQKAMEPVSERVGVLEEMQRLFNFKHKPGQGLQPTDTTATKIQTSLRDNKAVTQGVLTGKPEQLAEEFVGPPKKIPGLSDYVGKDYSDLAQDYQLANQFDKTAAQGSRRTVLGTALGGLFGHGNPIAMGAGALTGATLDKYGGQALGKMIDTYVKAGNSQAFGKFAPVLEKAAHHGPEALAVAGSVLSNNPEFKKIVEQLTAK